VNKILLALITLSAGAVGFQAVHQSATRLEHEAKVLHDDWLAHSQIVASAQADIATVNERVSDLKQSLRQSPPVTNSPLWSALQGNRADRLPLELRNQVREELGFHWRFSPDYIVVSKQAVRDIGIQATSQGKLTDVAAAVLTMTPEERSQVETAIGRVRTDFRDWVLANVERIEPGDDVVAQYALPTNPVIGQTISNALVSAVSQALGQERAGLVLPSLQVWMRDIVGLYDSASAAVAFTIKRSITGDETQLKARVTTMRNDRSATDSYTIRDRSFAFPRAFRSIFPNAWADVAEREGFELPKKPEKK
jgi:hypothetical protein